MKSRYLKTPVFAAVLSCSLLLASGCGGDSSGSNSSLTGIDIAPISPSIPVGGTQQFAATGHFSNGPDQDLTANSTWTSSVTTVATIQSLGTTPGLATGVSVGSSMITASFAQGSGSVSASTTLTVTADAGQVSQPSEGMATVSFLAGSGGSINRFKIDGRSYSGGTLPTALPAGLHRFVSPNGKHTTVIILEAQHNYSFQVLIGGRIVLSDGVR